MCSGGPWSPRVRTAQASVSSVILASASDGPAHIASTLVGDPTSIMGLGVEGELGGRPSARHSSDVR